MYRYRSNPVPPPHPPKLPPPHMPPPPPAPPPPPKPLNKCAKPPAKKKKKLCFKSLKKDTCSSLNDVEHFLCNFSSFIKYIKLYNLLKK